MNIEELKNKIACLDAGGDNVGIALCCFFDDHIDKPENDPVDEETGWGDWVLEQSDIVLERIAECVSNNKMRRGEQKLK